MHRRTFLITASLAAGSISLGGLYWTHRWKYIVIHHSAGRFGSIPFLQKVHKERQAQDPIDAIAYHYIIGNGHGLAMGQVDSDWRQHYALWGAHVSNANRDHNFRGIGICLIGNFERHPVPPAQYTSLVQLTKQLMTRYSIPAAQVNGHGYLKGESTKCPGKFFPMDRFKQDIT